MVNFVSVSGLKYNIKYLKKVFYHKFQCVRINLFIRFLDGTEFAF